MRNIRFAFALRNDNLIYESDFSKAEKFQILEYLFMENTFQLMAEIPNPIFNIENPNEKYWPLIRLLNENKVNMLVAKSYGLMLHLQNKSYVPIIISKSTIEDVFNDIIKHINWISDELLVERGGHLIFNIENGKLTYKLIDEIH